MRQSYIKGCQHKVYGYKEYVDGVIIFQKYSKSWYAIRRA